ncbi:glycoside hydrolase [uncultured Bacteroides sp.]|uniref:glycoside hydrolase family protein n=1 Tax=uncultured Bacteroides sp. TaxID=162156 RepID=UPI0025998FAA|nr:glycoside hydrolase [uncultured Bacteroides sp.]
MRCRARVAILLLLLLCGSVRAQDTRFEAAVACIKRYEGMHDRRHHPYVGYGHKLLDGESFPVMTETLADSLLRSDLKRKCAVFRRFGADSLLLGVLAYNVGEFALLGHGTRPKSRLIRKLEDGDRDIHTEYVAYCHYKGKAVASIRQRREEEFKLLYIK